MATKTPIGVYAELHATRRALEIAVTALEKMTERDTYNPLNDPLIRAVDALQARVAELSAGAPVEVQAAFNAALGDLLRVIFERVTSMAATPTVILEPRLERLEEVQARMIEDIVHRLAAAVPVQALTERMDDLETRVKVLEDDRAA